MKEETRKMILDYVSGHQGEKDEAVAQGYLVGFKRLRYFVLKNGGIYQEVTVKDEPSCPYCTEPMKCVESDFGELGPRGFFCVGIECGMTRYP